MIIYRGHEIKMLSDGSCSIYSGPCPDDGKTFPSEEAAMNAIDAHNAYQAAVTALAAARAAVRAADAAVYSVYGVPLNDADAVRAANDAAAAYVAALDAHAAASHK